MESAGAQARGRQYVRAFDHDEARRRLEAGEKLQALADEYGVTRGAVWNVATEKGRAAARRSAENAKQKHEGQGVCDDCGGPMNLASRLYAGSTRCEPCAAIARATSARPDALHCSTCDEWKADEAFPSDKKRIGRRGRHRQCTVCQTAARKDWRHRNAERQRAYDREYKRRRASAP